MNLKFSMNLAPYMPEDIIVIREEDRSAYEEYFKLTYYPKECYLISKNVNTEDILIFLYYIKYTFHSYNSIQIDHSNLQFDIHSKFFFSWENFLEKMNSGKAHLENYEESLKQIKYNLPALLSDSRIIFEILGSFIEKIMMPILEMGPHLKTSRLQQTDSWHHKLIPHKNDLISLERNIRNAFGENDLTKSSISIIERYCKIYDEIEKLPVKDKFYKYSLYFGMLAAHFYAIGQHTFSLIYSHRALDLFFLSLACGVGLIIDGIKKIEYMDKIEGRDMVTLNNTVFRLIQCGTLPRNTKMTQFLTELNIDRNRAMIAHGIYSCTQLEAKKAIRNSKIIIKSIEGTKYWEDQVSKLDIKKQFEPKVIFSRITSLDTFVKKIL